MVQKRTCRRYRPRMWLSRWHGCHGYQTLPCMFRMTRFKRILVLLTSITSIVVVYITVTSSEFTVTSDGNIWFNSWKTGTNKDRKDKDGTDLNFRPQTAREHHAKPHVKMPYGPRETTSTISHLLSEAEVASRFNARRRLLQKACDRHAGSINSRRMSAKSITLPTDGFTVLRVIYCPIPKISSSTWKKIFKAMTSKMAKRTRKSITFTKARENKDDVYFTFVREPYGRLLSAYVDKIFTPNTLFSKMVGRYIVKMFRPNASQVSLRCGFDVTFPEFIKFFIHMQKAGTKRDPHFVPAHQQCEMCKHPYTYIGHLETLKEDMPFILKAIRSPVSYNKNFDNVTLMYNSRMTIKRMGGKIGSCMQLDEAARRLWKKWQIRGIISKSQSFPLTREDTQDISVDAVTAAGLSALARSGPKRSRAGQKKEALREAFSMIPLEDKLEVKKLLALDFELFGFNPEPEEVFPSTPYERDPHFSYFDLYQ